MNKRQTEHHQVFLDNKISFRKQKIYGSRSHDIVVRNL